MTPEFQTELERELYEALAALMAHEPDHSDTLWSNAKDALRKARGEA